MRNLIHSIDRFIAQLGVALAWLSFLMMLTTCAVVFFRYGLSQGFIALQESITYLHATLFMLGAAFALQRDAHVRVDIFYRNFSPRTRAWVNSLGTLIFLMPFCIFTLLISWEFFMQSWRIAESSAEPGGIPAVFLLKLLIPLMSMTLFLQGLAELLRNLTLLMGFPDELQISTQISTGQ